MSEPARYVSQRELRDMFNTLIVPDLLAGRLKVVTIANKHPSSNRANEPFCTRSQFIEIYSEDGVRVAGAHQYLRTDGTLGASGRPDPKIVVWEGVTYRVLEP